MTKTSALISLPSFYFAWVKMNLIFYHLTRSLLQIKMSNEKDSENFLLSSPFVCFALSLANEQRSFIICFLRVSFFGEFFTFTFAKFFMFSSGVRWHSWHKQKKWYGFQVINWAANFLQEDVFLLSRSTNNFITIFLLKITKT